MDWESKWNDLSEQYADEKARLINYLSKVSPASDEYQRAVQNLRTLKTVESQDAENLVSAVEKSLKERELNLKKQDMDLRAEDHSLKKQEFDWTKSKVVSELDLKARELDLKERELAWGEAKDEAEANKPEMGLKDWLQIGVPAVCVVLTLALEFGANGVVTSKVFSKLPFFR